jgi:very-short-patch-repair endonuclease
VGAKGTEDGVTLADFAHRQRRVAIYCDSHLHGALRIRELDNRVVEALQEAGWFLVRLTGREIQRRPEECLARIRRALQRAREQSAA